MWRGMMQGDSVGSMRQQGNKALNDRRIHPTQKPAKLYEWLMQQYAHTEMKILDANLGSGSAAIAAHYFGVHFVGGEIDADYCDAAKARLDAETRQIVLLAPNSQRAAGRRGAHCQTQGGRGAPETGCGRPGCAAG